MSATINGLNIVNGMEVKFSTYNKTDVQTYRGSVVGLVGFDVARVHDDIIAIHNNMDAEIAKLQVVSQEFILLKTADGAIRPFATCWIKAATFERTDNTADCKLVVYGVTEYEAAKIMTYIRDLGFECEKI